MQRQRGELVPIGDAVSGLRSPVTTKPKTKRRGRLDAVIASLLFMGGCGGRK